jgi:GGDEF domain-containing protein
MGGDEFAVLWSNEPDDLTPLTRRLEDTVGALFVFEQSAITLEASIGAAVFRDDGSEPHTFWNARNGRAIA